MAARGGAFLAIAAVLTAKPALADDDVTVRGRQPGAGFVSRASIDDSPREITDAASLVAPMPGVHVRRLGADDSFATLSIRGTSSTQVAVYLAGVPLTGGADPTLDISTLPLWPGAEARVYRSFAPAALGPGSLGGTLVLDPSPSPRAEPRTDVWAAAGSFGSRRLRIGDVRGDPDGVRVATGLSASRSDDDFSYLDPLATQARGTDVFTNRQNAGHAAASGLASVAMPAGSGALTMTALAQGRKQELPGPVTLLTPYQRLDSSRLVLALELTEPAGPGAYGVRTWARREGLSLHDAPPSITQSPTPELTDDAIVATGFSTGWKGRPGEPTSIEARVDGSAERFAPGDRIGALPPPGARRSSLGAALDAGWRAVPEVLELDASARADAWLDTSDDGGSNAEARPTGHVGAEWTIDPVVVAAHGGVQARPASFVERFGNRGAFIGDPNLRPESATTMDLGVRLDRRIGLVRIHFEVASFATWAEDLIVFVPQGVYGRAKATNVGKARLLGAEGDLRVDVAGADLRVSYTGMATANESACADAACDRPPLPYRPEHDVVGDLGYTLGPVHLRYGLDLTTGLHADLTGSVVVPDRVLHSAGARVAVPGVPELTIALDVRNLFDLRVAEYDGAGGPVRAPIGDIYDYPLPGRSFLLSARFTQPAR